MAGGKHMWEMTQEEWFECDTLGMGRPKEHVRDVLGDVVTDTLAKAHRKVVENAYNSGEPVPEDVLDEYPELRDRRDST